MTTNGLDLPMTWRGQEQLDKLVGQQIRLRLSVRAGAVYGLRMGNRTGADAQP